MAQVQTLEAVLRIPNGNSKKPEELPVIIGKSAMESLDHYSMQRPSLSTATLDKEFVEGNKIIYPVKETLGTKG